MIKIREDLYQIGDRVEFRHDYGAEYIPEHGVGPFPVLHIVQHKNVWETDEFGAQGWSCAGIGHTQWITIELAGEHRQFSGAYFVSLTRE